MYFHIVTLLAVVAVVYSHDLIVGQNNSGKKIFDEKKEASPAVWRQVQNVTVNATNNEVISRVVVTDLRPEKDGEAKIVDGGEGHKNVTIELKSPTVFRGYDFHIEVYSVPDKNQLSNTGKGLEKHDNLNHPSQTRTQRNPEDISKNINVKPVYEEPQTNSDGTTKLPELSTNKNAPVAVATSDTTTNDNVRKNRDTENKKGDESNVTSKSKTDDKLTLNPTAVGNVPAINSEPTRNSRDAESHNHENSGIPSISVAGNNPRLIPSNEKNENATGIPTVLGRDLKDDQARHARETQDHDKKVNEPNPHLTPKNVDGNLHSTTETSVTIENHTSRNTRDVQVDGVKPSFSPSLVGKSLESSTNKPTTYDHRVTIGNVPTAHPTHKNVEEKTTHSFVNNDKVRKVRDTHNVRNIKVDEETKKIPTLAASDVSIKDTKNIQNTPVISEKSTETHATTEDKFGAPIRRISPIPYPIYSSMKNIDTKTTNIKDEKPRDTRDTQHEGKTEVNIPKLLIDNNGERLNTPKTANKNLESTTNEHRHSRETEKTLPNVPAILPINRQKQPSYVANPSTPKTNDPTGTPKSFVDNRGDRRYSLPYPLSASIKPTSITTGKPPSKRDADSTDSKPKNQDDAKLKESPKVVGAENPKHEHKPVISIQ